MPKVNVYLSQDLADAVKTHDVALSEVCQRALGAEVARHIATRRARKAPAEVAARLLATESRESERQFLDGFDVGTKWAREHATLQDLREVARLEGREFSIELGSVPSLFAFLAKRTVEGEVEPDTDLVDGEDSFSAGLISGASEVYRTALPYLRRQMRAPGRQRGKRA